MDSLAAGTLTALWLGILTSISPCPLATNVAAISYIGKQVGSLRTVIFSGIMYNIGRIIAYTGIGVIVIAGAMSIPVVSQFLQRFINLFIGPILILGGMFLLELLSFSFSGLHISDKIRDRSVKSGIWGACLLGILFALSFCPISAAFFFGSLIPLSIKYNSYFLLPSLYGIGTGLPVFIFSIVIAFGFGSIGNIYNKLLTFQLWARRITGTVFIGVGIYLTLYYVYEVF
ncbi:aromatic aminobenezylarsenical efflux permease ArsG family transporter [candidate division KSB1 bacterium]